MCVHVLCLLCIIIAPSLIPFYPTDESVIQNKNSCNHGDEQADPKPAVGKEVTGGIRKVQMDKKEVKKLGKAVSSDESPSLSEKGLTAESQKLGPSWQ